MNFDFNFENIIGIITYRYTVSWAAKSQVAILIYGYLSPTLNIKSSYFSCMRASDLYMYFYHNWVRYRCSRLAKSTCIRVASHTLPTVRMAHVDRGSY